MMTLVPDYAIKKLKLFLIPEAEHCGLNYYGFLSMTVTGAKYTLFLIVLLKIHTLSGSISWIVHLWECLPPPPPELFQGVICTYHWPAAVPCWEAKVYNSDQLKIPAFKHPPF